LYAQSGEASTELETGTQEVGFWGGSAAGNTTTIGRSLGQRMTWLAVRYGVVFAHTRNVSFEYTADFLPVVVNFQASSFKVVGAGNESSREEFKGRTITGFGIAPLGIKATFHRRRLVQPFVESTAGVLRTRDPVPVAMENSTRWNLTWDVGAGLQLLSERGRAFRFGYRFHQVSAAQRLTTNPGIESHFIFAGLSFFR
jgi:hypothetical protein